MAAAMFGVGWGANQFAPMLLAYHQHLSLSVGTDQALFGIYALGLIPALLLGGPASDVWGRCRLVRPAVALSAVATVVLIVGSHSTLALYGARFLAGIASGTVVAAGTAWVKELSEPPYDLRSSQQTGARRAAISLSAGFGIGPVVAGLIAQWSPAPLVLAYVPHLVVILLVLPGLWRASETVPRQTATSGGASLLSRLRIPQDRRGRYFGVVVPMAPWVFAAPSVAFVVLPLVAAARLSGIDIAFAGITAGVTLGVGVAAQPLGRRLEQARGSWGAKVGLGAVTVGLAIASLATLSQSIPFLLLAASVLGVGYGLTLVAGLLEVQQIAAPDELAGLTAIFYALTYVGFAVPLILAELRPVATYPVLLLVLAGIAGMALLGVSWQSSRHPDGARTSNGQRT